jgi:ankyrin repeat protein
MQAATFNKVRAMTWLLDRGAKVDGPDPSISTPLVEAARAGAIEACRFLLEHEAAKQFKTSRGTAIGAANGWLKMFIRGSPESSWWNLPLSSLYFCATHWG